MFEDVQNDCDEVENPYRLICDKIDSIDDSLDGSIRCVFETESYQKDLKKLSDQPKDVSVKNKSILAIMAPFLLKSLNNPFFDIDEVKEVSKSTGLTERQIRDFLRNQRKRKINYLNELHDIEKQNIETKLNYLYSFIEDTIKEYVEMSKNEPQEINNEQYIYFPIEKT